MDREYERMANTIVGRLLKQGEYGVGVNPATGERTCNYELTDGRRCAVGLLLADYPELLKRNAAENPAMPGAYLPEWLEPFENDLTNIQLIHDTSAVSKNPRSVVRTAVAIAEYTTDDDPWIGRGFLDLRRRYIDS